MSTPASNQALYSLNTLTEISLKPQVNFDQPPTVQGVPLGGGENSNINPITATINPVRTTLTGNGALSLFSISGASGLSNPSALIVSIDGALQEPSIDYTVSSGNITFTDALPSGSKAVVISLTNSSQDGGSSGSDIPDNSITTNKLANNSVTTNKIVDGNITSDKLANNSISRSKLSNEFIQFAKLSSVSSRNNTSLQIEQELSNFILQSGVTYKVEVQLFAFNDRGSTVFPGISCQIYTPQPIPSQWPLTSNSSMPQNIGHAANFDGTFKEISYKNFNPPTIELCAERFNLKAQNNSFTGFFIFTPSTNGTLQFYWSQHTLNASFPTSLLPNSCITVTKLST
jgi:hypothetical protein